MTDEIREARLALSLLEAAGEHQADPSALLDVERENAHLRALRQRARRVVVSHDRAQRTALLRSHGARCSQRSRRGYVSPAVELQRRQWECIAAMVAVKLLAPKLTVVASGLDTVELHTKSPVGAHVGQRLEALFDLAQRTGEAQEIELAGVDFGVRPRLVKGGWLLANAFGDVVVRVRADAEPTEAAVIVELHAAALWARGWREAGDLAQRICEAITGSADVDLQVTRLDVCVDFQGWQPTAEDRELFTTRAKRIASYREGLLQPEWEDAGWIDAEAVRVKRLAKQLERADSPDERRRLLEVLHRPSTERATHVEYDAGRMAFTGFAFGRGGCLGCRLYNKSREIRVTRKGWFHGVWSRSPAYRAPPGGSVNGKVRAHYDVWRCEFQLRREALKQLVIERDNGKWVDLTSWAECSAHIDQIWQKLSREWVRHGWRTKDDRQAMSAQWRTLQRATIAGEAGVGDLHRVIPQVAVEPTLGSVAGYLTTAAAQLLEAEDSQLEALGKEGPAGVEWARESGRAEPADFGAVMTSVLAAAFEHAESRKQLKAEEIAREKARLIRERRAFLARRDTTKADERKRQAASAQRYGRWQGIGVLVTEADDEREALARKLRYLRDNEASRAVPF